MKIGYARVSTVDQTLNLQIDALRASGCDKIFKDFGMSGANRARPGLIDCLNNMGEGDCLVVYKLDRLGRSLGYVIETIDQLSQRKIHFQSVTEGFNTNTPSGKMIFHVIGALAEFERDLIRERVTAGVRAAQARGIHCGQHKKLSAEEIALLRTLRDNGAKPEELAETYHISVPTVYRYLKGRV